MYHQACLKKGGKRSGWTVELRYLPHASSGLLVVFLVLPGSPRPPLTRCSASEDSIDLNSRIYSGNSLCFILIPSCFSHVRCTAHCHQQCVRAKIANRASHISCNIFFEGHDPFTHVCEARPPTVVGRTSLSVSLSLSSSDVRSRSRVMSQEHGQYSPSNT